MNNNVAPYTTIRNQVIREVNKLTDWFSACEDRLGPDGYRKWSSNRTTQLRFDSEVDDSILSYTDRVNLAMQHIIFDLNDLVTMGDVNQNNDALLKACDGYVALEKRGKKLVDIEISSAQLFQEYKPKQNKYDYTLYCVLYLKTE